MPTKTVEHRIDGIFELTKKQLVAKHKKGGYIQQLIIPVHLALSKFLANELVGREFTDDHEIEKTLEKWPKFLCDNTDQKKIDTFGKWELVIKKGGGIFINTSVLGDFQLVAQVVTMKADPPPPTG